MFSRYIVPLLFLARTSIASLTENSTSKAAKIVVRHKIVSVRAEWYVSQQSSTPEKPKGKFFQWVEMPQRSPRLVVKRLDHYVVVQHFSRSVTVTFFCFTTNSVLVLFLVLCEVSVDVFVHVRVQAKNSNWTTVRAFSHLLCHCCTLLPFPSTLTSLCAPV